MTIKKRGALEISFGWIFAIVAGIFIIFLAIYLSSRLINTEQETTSAETGTQISVLLNPLETSFESSQTTSIIISSETRIHNICDNTGNFGEQTIQLDQKNLNKWIKTSVNVQSENKYLFSTEEIEGKKFYVFSKPFDFPFKIADLIYMTSANDIYCFVNAPNEVSSELTDLNQSNLLIENCPANSTRVCFDRNDCEVNVDYNSGTVEKGGDVMYFAGTGNDAGNSLMYAAIFSDSYTYECQLKRLMAREKEIALIYKDKETRSLVECEKNLGDDLNELSYSASNLNNSAEVSGIKTQVDIINDKNEGRRCLLW